MDLLGKVPEEEVLLCLGNVVRVCHCDVMDGAAVLPRFWKRLNTDRIKIHLTAMLIHTEGRGKKSGQRVNQDEQTRAINTCVPCL